MMPAYQGEWRVAWRTSARNDFKPRLVKRRPIQARVAARLGNLANNYRKFRKHEVVLPE